MNDDDGRYPVMKDDDDALPQCRVCMKSCGEPGDFLELSAGAILHDDETRMNGGPDDLMSAHLTLIKHGAEPEGPYVVLEIVRDLIGGQAELLFCSGECLRRFFKDAVDELERRWERERRFL